MEDRIYNRLIEAVRSFALQGETKYRVSLPNKSFNPTTYPYLEVRDFKLDVKSNLITCDSKRVEGLLQIAVVEAKNVGTTRAKALVSEVLEAFPEGRLLYDNDIVVTVHNQPNEMSLIDDDKDVRIPIIIPYQSFIPTSQA